jgi:hypothetical protein
LKPDTLARICCLKPTDIARVTIITASEQATPATAMMLPMRLLLLPDPILRRLEIVNDKLLITMCEVSEFLAN